MQWTIYSLDIVVLGLAPPGRPALQDLRGLADDCTVYLTEPLTFCS